MLDRLGVQEPEADAAGEATEPEEKLSATMIDVWEELSPDEKQGICNMCGNYDHGKLALSKISTVLKAIYYKHPNMWSLGQAGYSQPSQYMPGGVYTAMPSTTFHPTYQSVGSVVTTSGTYPLNSGIQHTHTGQSWSSGFGQALGGMFGLNKGQGTP